MIVRPAASLAPASPGEAAEFVRQAVAAGLRVAIEGSGSRADWAPSSSMSPSDRVLLRTIGLGGLGEVRAENLTATFPAGTRLSLVQAQLRRVGLWLPLEHADGPDATLGGCLAAGFVNPLRWSRGTPRDWVLGLQVVDATGRLLSLGGEVIKNVAGYDVVRMHLGAWGRLGLITQATLRLLPLPESEATVVATFRTAVEAARALRVAARHPVGVATLEVVARLQGVRLMARLVGDLARLELRAAELREVLTAEGARGTGGGVEVHLGLAGHEVWRAYAQERAELAARHTWRLKLALPAPGLEEAFSLSARACAGREWALVGQGGNGVYSVFWADERGPLSVLGELRAQAGSRAFVVAEGRAAGVVAGSPGWESFPPRSGRSQDRLERALLEVLAPGRVFNPHLYVDDATVWACAR